MKQSMYNNQTNNTLVEKCPPTIFSTLILRIENITNLQAHEYVTLRGKKDLQM